MGKHILRATSASWDEMVVNAKGLILVEFWAMWCSPCRELVSMVKELAEEHAKHLTIIKVDKEDCPDIAEKYDIMGVPSFLFFKDGKKIDRIVGIVTKKELNEKIAANI